MTDLAEYETRQKERLVHVDPRYPRHQDGKACDEAEQDVLSLLALVRECREQREQFLDAMRERNQLRAAAVAHVAAVNDTENRDRDGAINKTFDLLQKQLRGQLEESFQESIADYLTYRKRAETAEARIAELEAEVERLRGHILDIDAHATPFGDIPDEPGYVGRYLLSAGALHRALGKIGHTAPSCEAEAKLAALTRVYEEAKWQLAIFVDKGSLPTLRKALADAEPIVEGES